MTRQKDDPRVRNSYFAEGGTVGQYLEGYSKELGQVLHQVRAEFLEKTVVLLEEAARRGKTVWVIGNGGSSAIADHLNCDWTKGTFLKDRFVLRTTDLSRSSAMTSAMANDFGCDEVFARQLEMLAIDGDLLLAISSSGNSPNIVRACEVARQKSLKIIGMTGFDGGRLKDLSDVNLHIPISNYGVVEDAHQVVMHVIAQFLYKKNA